MICLSTNCSKNKEKTDLIKMKIDDIDSRIYEIREKADRQDEPKMVELALIQEIQEYFILIPKMISELVPLEDFSSRQEESDYNNFLRSEVPLQTDPILKMMKMSQSSKTDDIGKFKLEF
mmetsp:Transcript_13096/g.14715  ORF Transcript_13096/g.14715 Transcript_13096/m.14715 type:complete len:120 (+) Transcript_13096:255-614(+)